jgi:transposase
LSHLRWLWRHLPHNGVLLFFDVQPIAVKAYGGRRYTAAPRLVLARAQKTRGRFYLFLVYDVGRGRSRWAYLPGKSSEYVCQFMQQVRRWYPDQEVRVALDQDPAHPRQSCKTRRQMRKLRLHWVSLPKGSPDDNPVETLFSDIQLMILDNSNDADVAMTQKRISAHLRGRNRRKERRMHLAYLSGSHHL